MSTRSAQPTSYETNRGQAFDASEALSLIDRHSTFDGTYRSSRDLRIEGQVKGTIECRGTVHVAQGAQVDALVEAENIVVAGELSGEITCRGRLQLMPTGRLRGKVSTQTLVINEGAIYEGQLEMMSQDNGSRLASVTSTPRPIAPVSGGSISPASQSQPAAPAGPAPMIAEEDQEPAAPQPLPPPAELRTRTEQTAGGTTVSQPSGANSSTFIRRFGGPETPFEGRRSEDGDETDER
ncbi:MAG TPA: polymer-forming cytoskeletal protein [Thermomicrobiales bacterium]|jgi:cytoskeletal protein CcmA (bactofilin family)|nr:polymer-forming cytoskeletal protein [Thermomicrobiales bacterium]